MQSTPVDFDAEQLLDPHVAEMDLTAKMIEKGELAWLIWRFEQGPVKAECFRETIREGLSQIPLLNQKGRRLCAFTGLNHELQRAGIQPSMSLLDPFPKCCFRKWSVVLFPKLELNVEAAGGGHMHNLTW